MVDGRWWIWVDDGSRDRDGTDISFLLKDRINKCCCSVRYGYRMHALHSSCSPIRFLSRTCTVDMHCVCDSLGWSSFYCICIYIKGLEFSFFGARSKGEVPYKLYHTIPNSTGTGTKLKRRKARRWLIDWLFIWFGTCSKKEKTNERKGNGGLLEWNEREWRVLAVLLLVYD